MNIEEEIDEELWFFHKGCEGNHFLVDNPHTFPGRILAWCVKNERSFFVSVSEIEKMSEAAKYWLKGFLKGAQPGPPKNIHGDVDFESTAYSKWQKSVQLFSKTGYWSDEDRKCKICETVILFSDPNNACESCKSN